MQKKLIIAWTLWIGLAAWISFAACSVSQAVLILGAAFNWLLATSLTPPVGLRLPSE